MLNRWRPFTFLFLIAVVLPLLIAGPARAQELGSRVNGLMTFDFSGDYITPRGLHVEDEGLVTQPLWLLFWYGPGPIRRAGTRWIRSSA